LRIFRLPGGLAAWPRQPKLINCLGHRTIFIDLGDGPPIADSKRTEIVKRSHEFVILPCRWVVERTFSWFGRNRRLAKDFENLAETLASFLPWPSSNSPLGGSPKP
jgi:transposase